MNQSSSQALLVKRCQNLLFPAFYSIKVVFQASLSRHIPKMPPKPPFDPQNLVLWRKPILTLWYFLNEVCSCLRSLLSASLDHKKLVLFISMLFLSLAIGYQLPGAHQDALKRYEEKVFWWAYWVFLGVLSSAGMGSGLHTFVLFLAPFLIKVTIAAYECESLDFPTPYPQEFNCPEEENVSKQDVSIWAIWAKVCLEPLMWGFGTALGELPPYFISKSARTPKDREKDKNEEEDYCVGVKTRISTLIQKYGFWTIFLMAAIPNPLFDLAGMTCGTLGVPFGVFFGATFLGKTFVKSQLQTVSIIFMFSDHHVDAFMDLLSKMPFIGEALNGPILHFIEQQKTKLHHGHVDESSSYLALLLNLFVYAMNGYFLVTIVNSWAQDYYHKLCEAKKAKEN
ncbi:hypothetical protein L596_025608 [Steinernema carpocapsae]|uniref:VTT domain-containing protein n=1 Tax=Steinernema carpocapsae TaxID=34508 RepID=A0A4U5M934_STECR|nr:hypothetical protein L596_025608 [Steinernema carpocapsae]